MSFEADGVSHGLEDARKINIKSSVKELVRFVSLTKSLSANYFMFALTS